MIRPNKDDGIQIGNWPVLSMYMPDGMTAFQSAGKTYLITANEGDAQDWEGFSEEMRVGGSGSRGCLRVER